MATGREREQFERRVRAAEDAGLGDVREELAIATGLSDGCTEGAPDVTLAETLDAPTMAERVRALDNPDVRLVLDAPTTVVFFGEAEEGGPPRPPEAEG